MPSEIISVLVLATREAQRDDRSEIEEETTRLIEGGNEVDKLVAPDRFSVPAQTCGDGLSVILWRMYVMAHEI
jgi:hypothetical protein